MKDYRVEVKIKNNYLLTKMMENGVANVAQLAKRTNSSPKAVGRIANLTISAYNKNGRMCPTVSRVCEFLACYPDDIFPMQHLLTPLHSNRSVVEADQEELTPGYLLEGTVDPLVQLVERDSAKHVHKLIALANLTARENRILTASFGLDGDAPKTHAALGEEFGVGGGRIQQIASKALRKLHHCAIKTNWHEGTDGDLHDQLLAEVLKTKKRFIRDQLWVRAERIHDELQRRSREFPYAKDRAWLITEFTLDMNQAEADSDEQRAKMLAQAVQRLKDKDKQELEALYWSLVDRIRETPNADMNHLHDELSRIRDLRNEQGCNEHADQYQRALDLLVVVEVDETEEEVSND